MTRDPVQVDSAHVDGYVDAMDRTHVRKVSMADAGNDAYVSGTPEERLALVWSLTVEVVALSRHLDAERRLQRHITRLIRRVR